MARAVSLMLGPLLVELAEEFHTSVAVAGQLAAATFITWGIAAPLVGPISDTYGRRPVLLTGLALMALGVLGSAAAWSYPSLLAFRLITGAAGGMLPPTIMAAVADSFSPEKRGKAVGFLTSSSWVGVALGVPAIALLAAVGGWRLPFYITGGLLVAVWGLLWLWLPKGQRHAGQPLAFFQRFKEIGRNKAPWYVLVANASHQLALIGLMTYLAAYMIESYGWDEGRTAPSLALLGVGAIIGSLAGGFIAGRTRRLDWVAAVGLAGGAVTGLLFVLQVSSWVAMALSFGAAVLLSVSMPVLMTLIMELAGQSRATASGMFGTSNQLGGVLGASAGGLMLSLGGFPAVGFFCLAAAGLSATVVRLKMRDSAEFRWAVSSGENQP
jgi:predicted MFS family arabinose efflux permease